MISIMSSRELSGRLEIQLLVTILKKKKPNELSSIPVKDDKIEEFQQALKENIKYSPSEQSIDFSTSIGWSTDDMISDATSVDSSFGEYSSDEEKDVDIMTLDELQDEIRAIRSDNDQLKEVTGRTIEEKRRLMMISRTSSAKF